MTVGIRCDGVTTEGGCASFVSADDAALLARWWHLQRQQVPQPPQPQGMVPGLIVGLHMSGMPGGTDTDTDPDEDEVEPPDPEDLPAAARHFCSLGCLIAWADEAVKLEP